MWVWEGILVSFIEKVTCTDDWGETPFHYAAKYGHLDICEYMIDQIECKNPTDDKGMTPLHNAADRGHLG